MQTIEDMKQRLVDAKAELSDAQTTARREKADAKAESRKPDPEIIDRPGKLEAEINELPDDIYATEIKGQQNIKASGENTAAEYEPQIQSALEAWREAQAEQEAAEKRVKETRAELDRLKSRADKGRDRAKKAAKDLEALYQRGPVDHAA